MPKNPDDSDRSVAARVTVRDFSGLVMNADPHDIEPGQSVHQVNVQPGPRGELRVRRGLAILKFDS